MSRPALPIYEATLTLPSGADVVAQGRPGEDPREADGWTLLAVETDERHPVRYALDDDGGDAEETLVRAALVERWTDEQRDIPPDDTAACAAEMRGEIESEARREALAEMRTMTRVVDLFAALRASARRAAKVQP